MRHDLESAMGDVITSRRAKAEFLADPVGFGARYDLSPAELDSLVGMREDLAGLTKSFVVKREGVLRGTLPHTFALIGAPATALLNEYTDQHRHAERIRDDQAGFGAALVALAKELAPHLLCGPVIADLARFELADRCGFWRAAALQSPPDRRSADPASFDSSRPLRLAATAQLADFGWDLRQLRSYTIAELEALPADPCTLVFFHDGRRSATTIIRLPALLAVALTRLADGQPCNAESLCAGDPRPAIATATLARLQSQGVLEWA